MWFWYVLAVLWLLDALRMRSRLKQLDLLEAGADGAREENTVFVTNPEVGLAAATRAQAARYMEKQQLELLDLIPAELSGMDALTLAQVFDPVAYKSNRLASGFSTGAAMAVAAGLASRSGIRLPERASAPELGKLAGKLRKFAGVKAGIAIAPGLKAASVTFGNDWDAFRAVIPGNPNAILILRAMMLVLVGVGVVLAPAAGLAALAAFHLQPLVALAGLPLGTKGLGLVLLLRYPLEVWSVAALVRSRMRSGAAQRQVIDDRRPFYREMLAKGTARFFEPRQEDCPVCASLRLKQRLRTSDNFQRKPGVFRLDRCLDCGHTFQNPRLSLEGLNFYYADFYDGLGGGFADTMFRARPGLYVERALTVRDFITPERWLDVGTGHGHFCYAARDAWPGARFDGLDISDALDEGVRAGWMDEAYRGFLPEYAKQLEGRYDVVSLFHCLEHVPEPVKDMRAAWETLAPGGFLLIEVPNPECRLGALFGKYWMPWFQPQHQNMFSASNLSRVLKREGFETVLVRYQEAHIAIDLFSVAMMLTAALAPKPDVPWLPKPGWFAHARHSVVWNAAVPVLLVAMIADMILGRAIGRFAGANAYRLVAKRVARPAEMERPQTAAAIA